MLKCILVPGQMEALRLTDAIFILPQKICNFIVHPYKTYMSALSALKGYRTQFLYSLYYILSHQADDYYFRLEGEEDIDILDSKKNLIKAIQVKNLSKTITLSDLASNKRTSFFSRFIENYHTSIPVLVSFGEIHGELLKWRTSTALSAEDKASMTKYNFTRDQWTLIKEKLVFQKIEEDTISTQVLRLIKDIVHLDPEPIAENMIYFLQFAAEKQRIISFKDILVTIERFNSYHQERISFHNQYGIYIKPLHHSNFSGLDLEKIKTEFYYGINARFEHVYFDLDVIRNQPLKELESLFNQSSTVIVHGASGQGKSSLAYRYLKDYAPESMVYEIDISWEDPKAYDAITAITGMLKNLQLPIYFVINVGPNDTRWLKIIKEFSNHSLVRMLVTVRSEDWHRAQSAQIDFAYSDLHLQFSREEATHIFEKLEERAQVKAYADFHEAWIDLGAEAPLLEFVYSITQGTSLKNRLQAQVRTLELEDAHTRLNQITFLKTLCLADAFGAKISVNKLAHITGIKSLVDKLEKEYLLKISDGANYITGLHIVRSKTLLEILFDEFLAHKKSFILPCLQVIDDQYIYPFLLQCFHLRVTDYHHLAEILLDSRIATWTSYGAIAKALLWLGARSYIDENKKALDSIYQAAGEAWMMIADIYHGTDLNLSGALELIQDHNPSLWETAEQTNKALTSKENLFSPIKFILSTFQPELQDPKSDADWSALADLLFWSGTLNISQDWIKSRAAAYQYIHAFSSLPLDIVASLMLGMHSFSEELDKIRLNHSGIFNTRMQTKYNIPVLIINQDITFEFFFDRVSQEVSGTHERTIEIIELFRTAYPDKEEYVCQGHGHRMMIVPMIHDDTSKKITAGNLALDHWTGINASLLRLFEYEHRPKDWADFHAQLDAWQNHIKTAIETFIRSFAEQRKNQNNFKPLVAVIVQAVNINHKFLPSPKSIVDPLGLYLKASNSSTSSGSSSWKEQVLAKIYKPFFKSYTDYKSSIENFIRQSGIALSDMLKVHNDPGHATDEHNLHLSFINLYNAVRYRSAFENERKQHFTKYIPQETTAVSEEQLFTTATIWKSACTAIEKGKSEMISLNQKITRIRNDFETSLKKSLKQTQRNTGLKVTYINDARSEHHALFICDTPTLLLSVQARELVYLTIQNTIKCPEYTSLKQLMLERYFSTFRFIETVNGRMIDVEWNESNLNTLREVPFHQLKSYQYFPGVIPDHVLNSLKLESWIYVYPRLQEIQQATALFQQLFLTLDHIVDLKSFNNNPDINEAGADIIMGYIRPVGEQVIEHFQKLVELLIPMGQKVSQDDVLLDWEKHNLLEIFTQVLPALDPQYGEDSEDLIFNMETMEAWRDRLYDVLPIWGNFLAHLKDWYIKPRDTDESLT